MLLTSRAVRSIHCSKASLLAGAKHLGTEWQSPRHECTFIGQESVSRRRHIYLILQSEIGRRYRLFIKFALGNDFSVTSVVMRVKNLTILACLSAAAIAAPARYIHISTPDTSLVVDAEKGSPVRFVRLERFMSDILPNGTPATTIHREYFILKPNNQPQLLV